MNKQISDIIKSKTHSSSIISKTLIQELWSGYGQISRVQLDKTSVILKLIKFPEVKQHPKGWNSNKSSPKKSKILSNRDELVQAL